METRINDLVAIQETATTLLKQVVANTFQMMAGMEAEIGQVCADEERGRVRRRISGLIGWVGEWTGTGILECSPEFASRLSNLMLGTEETGVNEDVLDAVAEMTNMIFGGMKTGLEPSVGPMGLSIPTVVYGEDVGMRSTGGTFSVLPVQIEGFSVKVMTYFARTEETRNSPGHFWAASATAVR